MTLPARKNEVVDLKLKNCPFCGTEAAAMEGEASHNRWTFRIKCAAGCCSGRLHSLAVDLDESVKMAVRKAVASQWNTRVKAGA